MNPQSKQSGASPLGVGVISIVTVLLVLCLTIFSALTLTTAKADLNLSRINADTVSAWYAADAEAARQYAAFAGSTVSGELEASIPIAGRQSLYLHLVRDGDGTVRVLAWRAVTEEGETSLEDATLPVWGG